MIGELKPYPAMKDSGVPWIGKMPSHWTRMPGRACYREEKVLNNGLMETIVLSLSYGKIVVKPPEKLHGLVPASFETYQIVNPGDIIVRPTDLQNDWTSLRFGLSRARGIITSAYMCLHTEEVVTRPYGHLLLHTYDLKKVFYGLGSGLRQNLDWRDFKCLPCIVPPLPEQVAIVRFLDHADRRIRRYIRAKQKLITLLEEQKQAIIHQAVTGQVDVRTGQPYPAYKPSGVEWLGDVPEHWEVRRNGRLFVQRNETGFPELPILEVSLNTGIRIRDFGNSDRKQIMAVRSEYKRAVKGDIAYNMMRMWQGAVGVIPVDGLVSPAYVVARPLKGTESRYFSALFRTNVYMAEVDKYSHGIVKDRNRLYWENFKQMPTPYPTPDEQVCIVRYLDKATAAIATDRAHRQIDLLREYRTRLIADVVTGKLDVREEEARLPEVDLLADEFDALTTQATETGVMELEDATELPGESAMENEATV